MENESQRAHTHKDLAHYFDPEAHNYHTETIATHKKWLAGLDCGPAVLDVGAGSGVILEQLLRCPSVRSVLAIDISEAALQKGREINKDPRVRFENRSVYKAGAELPGRFDAALFRFALHHFEQAQSALDNVAAALKPGGKVLLLDVLGYADPEVDELFGRITRIRQPADYKFYSKPELEAMFARAGVKITAFKSESFALDLKRWLGEYQEPERVLAMFEGAPAKAKEAFRYRAGDRPGVEFLTYFLVGERRA